MEEYYQTMHYDFYANGMTILKAVHLGVLAFVTTVMAQALRSDIAEVWKLCTINDNILRIEYFQAIIGLQFGFSAHLQNIHITVGSIDV